MCTYVITGEEKKKNSVRGQVSAWLLDLTYMFEVVLRNGTTQAVQLTPGFSSHDGRVCESIAIPFPFLDQIHLIQDMHHFFFIDYEGYAGDYPKWPFTSANPIHHTFHICNIIVTINRSTEHLWLVSFSRKIEMYLERFFLHGLWSYFDILNLS